MDRDDKELAAMITLYLLLKPFDPAARHRIAGYIGDRLQQEDAINHRGQWEQQSLSNAAPKPLAAGLFDAGLVRVGSSQI